MVIWKQLRRVHILVPEELLARADQGAKDLYMSRSEYIREVLNKSAPPLTSDDLTKRNDKFGVNPAFLDADDS